jgi:mono/diheme cytochrome c family protein
MRKLLLIFMFLTGITASSMMLVPDPDEPVFITPSPQRIGNADSGYKFIVEGDYVNSGLPVFFYRMGFPGAKDHLKREGRNAGIRHDFNVVQAPNGEEIIVPNCLQCHAQEFNGELIMGLGNANADFTGTKGFDSNILEGVLGKYMKVNKKKDEASKEFLTVSKAISTKILTPVRGVNSADKLAAVLISHRDRNTLAWNDTASVELPDEVIPSDVPAWWLLKKKNAMFYNGFGRGDFGTFLMGAILLTVNDTAHANKVNEQMDDVLAYLRKLEPPKYPFPIDSTKASAGKLIFEKRCSSCHGTYGNNPSYPNYLIPQQVIGTDSLLNKSNYQYSDMIEWFNTSWFSRGENAAKLVPFNGYIAPPLDGVWITAPYLHNGSVPTIEALLHSRKRPVYWSRNFSRTEYDYSKLGWKYKEEQKALNKNTYNTTLPGYGNYGHYFGDRFTDQERTAVIEYLKTL